MKRKIFHENTTMNADISFGSVCSGIEAASVAFGPLGWRAAWLAEIEQFPGAVLAHHYPDIPNLGDMTKLAGMVRSGQIDAPDVLCGGTPCQAFSIAGYRRSLDDARGNLTLTFCDIAEAIDATRHLRGHKPAIIFWENVPGVLSTKDNAFGCFLAQLCGGDEPLNAPGGKWPNAGCVSGPKRTAAWRVLDAQHFGLAQRRKRVFVVASAGNGFDPTEVLFEFDGVRRDTGPSRVKGQEVATGIGGCAEGNDEQPYPIANCLTARMSKGFNSTLDEGQTPVLAFDCKASGMAGFGIGDIASTMHAMGGSTGSKNGGGQLAVAYTTKLHNTTSNNAGKIFEERAPCHTANSPPAALLSATQVRRLTPRECERLMGFPDDYTRIPWRSKPAEECPDGLRYKALGNSWAVPVVAWIGKRISLHLR
jgi:DNA (cytosine-5)-methyltransferase 1